MDRKLFSTTFQALKARTPFRPFTVVKIDGSRHEVDRADAFIERDGMAGFIDAHGMPVIFDYDGVSQVVSDSGDA